MDIKKLFKKVKKSETQKENIGSEVSREVLISPSKTGNNFLKLSVINVPSGAQGTSHVHLGEEVVYTLKGEVKLLANGKEYVLEEGSAFVIPPDIAHPVKVTSTENWVAVAAYCDECPILKKFRNKENVDYPLDL